MTDTCNDLMCLSCEDGPLTSCPDDVDGPCAACNPTARGDDS